MTNQAKKIRLTGLHVVYISLLGILLLAQALSPNYLSIGNITNVLRQASFLGIVAIGQTLVILSAGTDLSVSYLVTMGNLAGAQIMAGNDHNILAALLAVALIGAAAGGLNATGVRFLRIPPLVMTLGVGSVLQGIYLLYSKGAPKGNAAPLVKWMVTGQLVGPFSFLICLWAFLSIVTLILLSRTTFGRGLYAIGKNPRAAFIGGMPLTATTYAVYMLSGALACITGMLLVGYTGTSFLDAGNDYQMNSIAAVVLGGTMLSGGIGGYGGTIGGTMILCVLLNILNILHIPTFGRDIIRGVVILLLLMMYGIQNRKEK